MLLLSPRAAVGVVALLLALPASPRTIDADSAAALPPRSTWATTTMAHESVVPHLKCDLLVTCHDFSSCAGLKTPAPPAFKVWFNTTAGLFNVSITTASAPPFAQRVWELGRLGYWDAARFYRMDASPPPAFVVQFGYRGQPRVDRCWDNMRTSNVTWKPTSPGNVRGSVSFSMNALPAGHDKNCTSTEYCAVGFSTNIFVNLGNNSRLDAPGFAPFGAIDSAGMAVIDRLFHGYGEVCDLCPANSTDPYCVGKGTGCKGCSMDRLLSEGTPYLESEFPKFDYVHRTKVYTSFAFGEQ